MTNEQILKKAIEKAVKGGYSKSQAKAFYEVLEEFSDSPATNKCFVIALIFSHDFAKHFWGEDWVCDCCGEKSCWEGNTQCNRYRNAGVLTLWEFQLQQMILKAEPLQYLVQFLNEQAIAKAEGGDK